MEFCLSVFRAQFAEARRIDDAAALTPILSRLGVDPAAVLDAAQSDANKAQLRSQTEEAQRLGIFGAPTFITADGELFWGNDRLDQALAWAQRRT
jgi:2-hydroxychromene-2-carboxylate isomerase